MTAKRRPARFSGGRLSTMVSKPRLAAAAVPKVQQKVEIPGPAKEVLVLQFDGVPARLHRESARAGEVHIQGDFVGTTGALHGNVSRLGIDLGVNCPIIDSRTLLGYVQYHLLDSCWSLIDCDIAVDGHSLVRLRQFQPGLVGRDRIARRTA